MVRVGGEQEVELHVVLLTRQNSLLKLHTCSDMYVTGSLQAPVLVLQ